MYKTIRWKVTFLVILIGLCVWILDPNNLKLGIDLQGGTELLYKVEPRPGVPAADHATAVKETLSLRLDVYGLKELSISTAGQQHILIEVPGATKEEVDSLKGVIERTGALNFHLLSEESFQTPAKIERYEQEYADWARRVKAGEQLPPPSKIVGIEYVKDQQTAKYKKDEQGNRIILRKYVLENDAKDRVDGATLESAHRTVDTKNASQAVGFKFNSVGAKAFGALTEANVDKSLVILLDEQVMSVANINSPIYDNGILTGNFTDDEITQLVTVLQGGSLTAELRLENEQTIGSVIGRETIERAAYASLWSFILVFLFMAIYYRTLGMVANVALLLNTLLGVAAVIAFRNTLTFPGLAGLLLSISMSVDANILIFERVREERARGRSINQSLVAGFERAFVTILDTNLTTLITCYILFAFGSGTIKGFAVLLGIGLICSFYTAIHVSRLLITLIMKTELVKDFTMMQLWKNPNWNFLKHQKACLYGSLIFIVLCIGTLIGRGGNALGLDFTGGSRMEVGLRAPVAKSVIEERLQGLRNSQGSPLLESVQVQAVGGFVETSSEFAIRTRPTRETEVNLQGEIERALKDLLAPAPFGAVSFKEKRGEFTVIARREAAARDAIRAVLASADLSVGGTTRTLQNLEVTEAPAEAALGEQFSAFRVSFEAEDEATATRLADGAKKALDRSPTLKLSSPFPDVQQIGSKVSKDLQRSVFVSVLLAFLAITFYCWLRFELKFGIAAVIALIHDVIASVGALAMADYFFGSSMDLKINLPVVAAMLTIIGFSINDTIVIFDRVRENLGEGKRGSDFVELLNRSINQTFGRTILTSSLVLFVVLVLLVFGGSGLQAFAFTMTVGVLIGTYTTMYIASAALIYLNDRQEKRRAAILAQAAGKPVGQERK